MDAATIDAARSGDRGAQARLLTALQDVWYRFALSLLRDADRAADATQETALRFLRQLPTYRGDAQVQTWSLGIALNVVREMRRRRPFEDIESAQEPTAATPSVASVPELDEEKAILKRHLDQLPERQREAIVLRFFEELDTEQTARAMDCAVGTVKATLHQGLRSLKQKMKQLRPDVTT